MNAGEAVAPAIELLNEALAGQSEDFRRVYVSKIATWVESRPEHKKPKPDPPCIEPMTDAKAQAHDQRQMENWGAFAREPLGRVPMWYIDLLTRPAPVSDPTDWQHLLVAYATSDHAERRRELEARERRR